MSIFHLVGSAVIAGSIGLSGMQPEVPGGAETPGYATHQLDRAVISDPLAIGSGASGATTGVVILASDKPKRAIKALTKVRNGEDGLMIVFLPSSRRAVPKHVYESHRLATNFKVPKGYSTVWEDDRLNPRRAEQSLGGYVRMHLIWTDTVPRRLIDKNTGQDMSYMIPIISRIPDIERQ